MTLEIDLLLMNLNELYSIIQRIFPGFSLTGSIITTQEIPREISMIFIQSCKLSINKILDVTVKTLEGKMFGKFGESQQFVNFFPIFKMLSNF